MQPAVERSANMEKQTGFTRFRLLLTFTVMAAIIFMVIVRLNPASMSTATLTTSRFERSILNGSASPCTLEAVSINETLDSIVTEIVGNYTTLLRMNVSVSGDSVTNYSSTDVIHPLIWYWSLGGRGRVLLEFPYNYIPLSFSTLKPGIRDVTVLFRATPIFLNMESIDKESCVFDSLTYLSRRVRMIIEEAGEVLPKVDEDLICREKLRSSPSPSVTKIPGYSLFELQASSYYSCNSQINKDVSNFITVLTVLTYLILLLAAAYKAWDTFATPKTTMSSDEVNTAREDENNSHNYEDEEDVNILRISIIPPVLLVLALNDRKHQKLYHLLYWTFIYLIPLLVYIIAVICHAILVDEYNYRRTLLGNDFLIREILCDHILVNVMYLVGVFIFLFYIRTYDVNAELHGDRGYSWSGKGKKVGCYTLVAIFCFFRLSASFLLVAEILSITLVGISINFNHLYPSWINVIVGVVAFVVYIVKFFDSYQQLFHNVYSIGIKVDKDNLPYRIFKQQNHTRSDESVSVNRPPTQFVISSHLLRDIIRNRLPFHVHIFTTVMHIVIACGIIAIIAVIVIYIDDQTDTSKLVEYALTVGSLLVAGSTRLGSNPCSASGKQKNRAQYRLYTLEEELRAYAETGRFPPPSSSCWVSFVRCNWCPPWCCSYCKYDTNEEAYRAFPICATSATSPDAYPISVSTAASTVVQTSPTGTTAAAVSDTSSSPVSTATTKVVSLPDDIADVTVHRSFATALSPSTSSPPSTYPPPPQPFQSPSEVNINNESSTEPNPTIKNDEHVSSM